MAKKTNVFIAILNAAIVICLSAGNGLATARYAKKYEIACKSCHSSGAELNPLGQKFWKNGHSFDNDDALQIKKLKQSDPYESQSRIAEPADGNAGRPPAVVQGITDNSAPNVITQESVPPVQETRVYRRKTSDGTIHFSDTPELNINDDPKSSPVKSGKKITRAGFRPLSAATPKAFKKTAVPKQKEIVSPKPAPLEQPVAVMATKDSVIRYRSFDQCMEQNLVSTPHPESSEAAMKQFQEAEDICAPYNKKQP